MANYVKPVVFKVGSEEYGVDIALVNAIENYVHIVPVPNSVAYVKGIINLRGEVIAVYDLRKKFNMPPSDVQERKLVIVKLPHAKIALEVDSVSEIHDFEAENIVSLPAIAMNRETKYFDRVANVNGRLIVLMDVEQLLSEQEQEMVSKLAEDVK